MVVARSRRRPAVVTVVQMLKSNTCRFVLQSQSRTEETDIFEQGGCIRDALGMLESHKCIGLLPLRVPVEGNVHRHQGTSLKDENKIGARF